MDQKGELHKGYINYPPEFFFHFTVRQNVRFRKIYFTVPIPDFKQHWTTLIEDNILFLGHLTIISFLKSATTSKNSPSLNYVSAKHLLSPCPPSLFKSLDHCNPDRQVWLDSYNEEKQGLIDHDVYETIFKIQYLVLKQSGKIPTSIPSMCVLVL